jgi:hypothetical protein
MRSKPGAYEKFPEGRKVVTTISGQVTCDETTAAYAVVELHNATDDVLTQVVVDKDGRYRFYVTGGIWRLRVWDPHGRRATAQATVSSGEDRTLDVRLR